MAFIGDLEELPGGEGKHTPRPSPGAGPAPTICTFTVGVPSDLASLAERLVLTLPLAFHIHMPSDHVVRL